MSEFSGRCDLYDHIMMEKQYPSETNQNILVSDEKECFEIFKEKTNGVIYQHFKLKLTEWNVDAEIANRNDPRILSKTTQKIRVPDSRCKQGYREVEKHTYYYYGKEYADLKELNKKHYYAVREIHFDTIVDLIPYYPYVIGAAACSPEGEHIVLASQSEIEETYFRHRENGYSTAICEYYQKKLQQHYMKIIKEYYGG